MNTRREFIGKGLCAACGAALAGCATPSGAKAPALAGNFAWGALLHLGHSMWGDWEPDGVFPYPRSLEEERQMVADGRLKLKNGTASCLRDYMSTDWKSWNEQADCMKAEGLNMLFVDVGEAYAFPSHPELHVKGSLTFDEMRTELARIRARGLEPIPKLNFSTGHDQWLREYHYMTSSPKYYQVVADTIADTCEVFGWPRYFHLGFDEEIFAACGGRRLCVMRTGGLWWKDCLYAVGQVERHGARAMLWSDKICGGRKEFLKYMPKSVLQVPWYYGKDFSEKKLTWKPEFETSQKWNVQTNAASSILVLAENGYDMMPCTSNWTCDEAADAMLGFCKKRVDPARIKGFMTAPWRRAVPETTPKALEGIRLFGKAKRKYYAV